MEDEYLNLLRLFHAEDVEYVIVGGYAVITHGFPCTTADLDILVRPTPANAQRVLRTLEQFGYVNGEFEAADFTTTPNFLSFSSNSVWIDLMTQLLGVSFVVFNGRKSSAKPGRVGLAISGISKLLISSGSWPGR